MKKMFHKLLYFSLPVLLIAACYPGGPEEENDMDIVGTVYDKDFDFTIPTIVYVADTVIEMIIPGEDVPEYSHAYDPYVTGRIRENLTAIGYSLTNDPTAAALWVTAAVTKSEQTGYYYDWWYYWGGIYYPYYPDWGGGYYPGYWPGYPATVYYTYMTGTILINMQDPDKVNNPGEGETPSIKCVWAAAINGLATSAVSIDRVNKGIDQAFTQSPYLGK